MPTPTTFTVQPWSQPNAINSTVSGIAGQFGVSEQELTQANLNAFSDPSDPRTLQAGAILNIPNTSPNVPNGGSSITPPVVTPPPASLDTDPVIGGTSVANQNNAIGLDLEALRARSTDSQNLIRGEMELLEARRREETARIEASFKEAERIQGARQEKDFAGRATGLVTGGGGFLGTTQSHQGVLQNMRDTFENERNALMAKRDTAIREAENAYSDKRFDLAQSLINEAKATEQEIHDRQREFASDQLALSREARSQTEFDIGLADKKIESYAAMSDEEFAGVDTTQIDQFYYPGYTAQIRAMEQNARKIETEEDARKQDIDIMNMRLKVDIGQSFPLGGVTYTGLKKPKENKPTNRELDSLIRQKISTLFSPGYTVPYTDGIPIISANGYATPEGWKSVAKEVSKVGGISRKDFIEDYGYLVNPGDIGSYGLSPSERKLITGF